ncbi:pilus assembly protein [Qipengyuania gaetbuli]|uniref:TadE/TadG family type IV pilus assembly protein n=1 Tax=Qipengyuania gaetbuli TaxID=266952 RepID=UPI001C99691F|nr:pilus assembly protein TadG-related protein [Qipengyuania gaetbuli]MBY6015520.1 pilus assembly protein [Qipengyuania gaetbuli]
MASALHHLRRFHKDQSGAVAATYALALIPLIAMAGLGFDYARMAGMDSELQNGADQAALAAATQLDGRVGACARAGNAAIGLVSNTTLLADGNDALTVGTAVGVSADQCSAFPAIRFFSEYTDRNNFTLATGDDDANYVEVTLDGREVTYSLVAVTGVANADGIALAVAGLGSAICKVPPVMMCNPNESNDPEFTIANYVGKGIRLVANVNGQNGAGEDPDEPVGSYGPGVFGYLETNAGNGAVATAQTLGRENFPGDCVSIDGADVKPGQQVSVLDALNVRFGIYANGLNNACGTGNTFCPPSANSRIDLVREVAPGASGGSCAIGPGGFEVGPRPYRPVDAVNNIDPANTQPMGYPRDKCHALSLAGSCTGNGSARIGDGNWDRAAYYATNGLGTMPTTWSNYGYAELTGRSMPTRYQQYRYDYDQRAANLNRRTFQHTRTSPPIKTVDYEHQGTPFCQAPGIAPASTPDRRILSIAVINCTAENVGANTTDADILKFVDVFLVEPVARRVGPDGTRFTNNSDVYVEVIGATTVGGGGTSGQEVRKDVPYLIE